MGGVPPQKQSSDEIASAVNLPPFALCGFPSISDFVFLILGLIVGGKFCDDYLTIPGTDLTQFMYIMLGFTTTYLGFFLFHFHPHATLKTSAQMVQLYNTVI